MKKFLVLLVLMCSLFGNCAYARTSSEVPEEVLGSTLTEIINAEKIWDLGASSKGWLSFGEKGIGNILDDSNHPEFLFLKEDKIIRGDFFIQVDITLSNEIEMPTVHRQGRSTGGIRIGDLRFCLFAYQDEEYGYLVINGLEVKKEVAKYFNANTLRIMVQDELASVFLNDEYVTSVEIDMSNLTQVAVFSDDHSAYLTNFYMGTLR